MDAPRKIGLEKTVVPQDVERVEHPPHYTWHPAAEALDITEHFSFCLGNAIKYIWRAGRKYPDRKIEDLKKAIFYLQREIAREEKMDRRP